MDYQDDLCIISNVFFEMLPNLTREGVLLFLKMKRRENYTENKAWSLVELLEMLGKDVGKMVEEEFEVYKDSLLRLEQLDLVCRLEDKDGFVLKNIFNSIRGVTIINKYTLEELLDSVIHNEMTYESLVLLLYVKFDNSSFGIFIDSYYQNALNMTEKELADSKNQLSNQGFIELGEASRLWVKV